MPTMKANKPGVDSALATRARLAAVTREEDTALPAWSFWADTLGLMPALVPDRRITVLRRQMLPPMMTQLPMQEFGLPMGKLVLKASGRTLIDPLSLSDCPGMTPGQRVSVEASTS